MVDVPILLWLITMEIKPTNPFFFHNKFNFCVIMDSLINYAHLCLYAFVIRRIYIHTAIGEQILEVVGGDRATLVTIEALEAFFQHVRRFLLRRWLFA